MEDTNNMESGFRINNILLTESDFSRISNVVFKDAQNNISINVNVSTNDKNISVEETVTFVQMNNNIEQVNIKVTMVGIFECIGTSEIKEMDSFGRINGASIIFPFIREHIANLSLKAGLGNVIIPPVNFTKLK
jgi:preprotein translocase subunit SecB